MNNPIFFKTSFSGHQRCFICRRRSQTTSCALSLKTVSLKTVAYAFLHHSIIINKSARCCYRHLDKNREVKKDHYALIKTHFKAFDCTEFQLIMQQNEEAIQELQMETQVKNEVKDDLDQDEYRNQQVHIKIERD